MLDQLNIETFQSVQAMTSASASSTTYVSNEPVKEKTIKEVPVIKTLQNFNTPIFSGAVDKPMDYELIWDNKDFVDDFDEELSIWVPKANEGFMAIWCVFVKSYKKPSLNDVVCVSVDYLKETDIERYRAIIIELGLRK